MSEQARLSLPRVLAILESFHTSAEIYLLRPLRTLAQQGNIQFEARLEQDVSPGRLAWADLVVYSRNVTASSHPLFEEVISRGLPSVYVLDDNFWDLPAELELDAVYRKSHQIQQLERYIRHASRVKVFSPYLAEKVRPLNPAVWLNTPCIDFSMLPTELPQRDPHKVKITYATARGTRDPFLALFSEDLRLLLQKYPQKVELHLFGEALPDFSELPNVHVIPLNWEYPAFIRSLAESGFDIGLAPMSETPFNLSKTNTKLRDYGACRIAGVYSNVQNYSDVQDGITGLIVHQRAGAWFEALERLVLDADLRRSIQENAYHYVYDNYRQQITEAEWLHEIKALTLPGRSLLADPAEIPGRKRLYFGSGTLPVPAWRVAASWQPGVDLVADLEKPLPFAAGALDAVCLDHQLEEISDMQETMAEIYRICRDGAAVSVVAAFARSDANAANPRLRQRITGHTPRYWTAADQPAPYLPEVGLPENAAGWGLNQDGCMDFRCVQVEFMQLPGYVALPAAERSQARSERWNVCDTIYFNLLVVKPPRTTLGMSERMVSMENFEPVEITLRRMRELTETQLAELNAELAARQAAEQAAAVVRNSTARLGLQMEEERKNHQEEIATLNSRLDGSRQEMQRLENEKKNVQASLTEAIAQQSVLRSQIAAAQAQAASINSDLQASQGIIGEYQKIGRNVALQLDEQRRRRIHRLVGRLRDRSQLLENIPPGLQQLVDDSYIFNQQLDGYLLQPGISLHAVPFIPYHLSPGRAGWCGVMFSGVLDVPLVEGYLGVEIVSAKHKIVAQATLPAIQAASYQQLRFEFPALADSAGGDYEIRVFGRNLDAPFRLLEWRKYRLGGLLSTRCKPFIGMIFE